jgi:hypothetical protein
MSDYAQGGIAHLTVEFLDHPQGSPVDPSAITLTIFQGSTTIAGPWTYPGTIVRDLLGLFHYDWSIPQAEPLGSYTASWTATVNSTQRTGYEVFNIVAGFDVITGNPFGWATAADVLSLTGATVSDAQLAQANAAIELHAGKVYSLAKDHTGARDLEWMRRACSYQAAWMLSQPDMFARIELEAVSATGRPVPIAPTALTLAPLARKALARVSWLKSRSLHIRSPFQDGLGPARLGGPIMDYDDDEGGW